MKRFGWLPDSASFETATIKIEPDPAFEAARSAVRPHISKDGWFYPLVSGDEPSTVFNRFELPPTHVLGCAGPATEEVENFLITFFGWLRGLRLVPEEWGHFYRAATKPGMLTDFLQVRRDVSRLLELAERFWHDHQPDGAAKVFFGALHWYLFSQSYYHPFERFLAQSMVLDTLYETHHLMGGRRASRHSQRVAVLADELQLELPSWGRITENGCELSQMRNKLIHESNFAGEPIGFAVTSRETTVLLGLVAFNCRVMAAIIGAHGPYSRSSAETMQVHGFDLD